MELEAPCEVCTGVRRRGEGGRGREGRERMRTVASFISAPDSRVQAILHLCVCRRAVEVAVGLLCSGTCALACPPSPPRSLSHRGHEQGEPSGGVSSRKNPGQNRKRGLTHGPRQG